MIYNEIDYVRDRYLSERDGEGERKKQRMCVWEGETGKYRTKGDRENMVSHT